MLQCWEAEAVLRPSFSDLVESVSVFLEDFAGYMDISAFKFKLPAESNIDTVTSN